MLIGHFGFGLGLKAIEPKASLGELFIAVQLSDILFFPLVAADVERGSIVPGITEASDLRLDYAPYTHGLIGVLALSVIVFLIYQLLPRREGTTNQRLGLVMAVGVFSHYILDVIVHTPDMAIVNGDMSRIGLELWDSAIGTYIAEAVLMVIGLWLYLRATRPENTLGKYGMIVFVGFLLLANIFNVGAPAPDEPSDLDSLVIPAVLLYLVNVGIAFWLDRQRTPIERGRDRPVRAEAT